MTTKPLNLSILIGDMNRKNSTPPVSPRPIIIAPNNKKSRIPLASAQNLTGPCIVNRGVTTFRQWADPPPPPIRSRTLDRKPIPTPSKKKRPGSADPRFRRSLDTNKIASPLRNDSLKQTSSFCELLTALNIPDCDEKPNESPAAEKKEIIFNNIEATKFSTNEGDIEIIDTKQKPKNIKDCTPRKKQLRSLKYDVNNVNINKNPINIEEILTLPVPTKEIEIKEIFNDKFDAQTQSQSESKYSQTDVEVYTDFNDMTEMGDQSEIDSGNNDIVQFIARNYERSSRFLDGIMLNRTRSISTVYELEPVSKIKQLKNRRNYGTVSRILLSQNYWTYVEIWAALSFFAAVLMFGWFYLIPYLSETFITWIYPRPPVTASDYFRRSISDIFTSTTDSFYNLLTKRRRL